MLLSAACLVRSHSLIHPLVLVTFNSTMHVIGRRLDKGRSHGAAFFTPPGTARRARELRHLIAMRNR